MTADLKTSLVAPVESAAKAAGLTLVSATQGTSHDGRATTEFVLALPGDAARPSSLS